MDAAAYSGGRVNAVWRQSFLQDLQRSIELKSISLTRLTEALDYLGASNPNGLAMAALMQPRLDPNYLNARLPREIPQYLPTQRETAEAIRAERAAERVRERARKVAEETRVKENVKKEAEEKAIVRARKLADEITRKEREEQERVQQRQRCLSMERLTASYDVVDEDGGVEALSDAEDKDDDMDEWAVVDGEGDVDEPVKI